jgi:hypothetical protein
MLELTWLISPTKTDRLTVGPTRPAGRRRCAKGRLTEVQTLRLELLLSHRHYREHPLRLIAWRTPVLSDIELHLQSEIAERRRARI